MSLPSRPPRLWSTDQCTTQSLSARPHMCVPQPSARVTFVEHAAIFPARARRYLPTKNEFAVACYLDLIPGLAEHFIYLNAGMFFGAAVTPWDFYTRSGLPKVGLQSLKHRHSPRRIAHPFHPPSPIATHCHHHTTETPHHRTPLSPPATPVQNQPTRRVPPAHADRTIPTHPWANHRGRARTRMHATPRHAACELRVCAKPSQRLGARTDHAVLPAPPVNAAGC
jgi:hypothetical protein